jgi:hypothetical protein
MGLRLLYGPVELVADQTDSFVSVVPQLKTWWPGVGGIVTGITPVGASFGGSTFFMALDGGASNIMPGRPVSFSWWPARSRVVRVSQETTGEYFEFVYEPKILARQHTHPNDQSLVSSLQVSQYIKLEGRRLVMFGTRIVSVPNGGNFSGGAVGEDFFYEGPVVPMISAQLLPGRSPEEALVSGWWNGGGPGQSARCAQFYNMVTQTMVSPVYFVDDVYTGSGNRAVFAPEFGVFVTFQEEDLGPSSGVYTIRVWATEVDPFELVGPTVYRGTVREGQVVTYRVRLLGAQGEPVEGELVNWMVTGVGVLLDTQSETDDEGYATVKVRYAIGEDGDSEVTASVRC